MIFLRLIQNEILKFYNRKLKWFMLGSLFLISILNLIIIFSIASPQPDNWENSLEMQIEEKNIEKKNSNNNDIVNSLLESEINIMKYRLENNLMPIYSDTTLGYINSSLGLINVITLFIIIISSSIVSQEYTWGTNSLLLIRPFKRWKILLSKYVSVIFIALIFIILLFLFSFLCGVICFGWDNQSYNYVYIDKDNIVKEVSVFIHFLQYIGSKLVGIIMISAFAFMLSTIFKNSSLAIALSIFIQYSGTLISNVVSIVSDNNITKYLFFLNTNLYQYVEGSPQFGMTIGFSTIVLLIYFTIFMSISFIVFKKRDIC